MGMSSLPDCLIRALSGSLDEGEEEATANAAGSNSGDHEVMKQDRLNEGFAALQGFLARRPGFRLFTILRYEPRNALIRRAWTSEAEAYPVGGTKPVPDSSWTQTLLIEGKPFLCSTAEDIRATFFDHEVIARLGCASALNLPVSADGVVIGSLNLLHEAHHYDGVDTTEYHALLQICAPALRRVPVHGDA
ncbi:GAF domain-containing protein [Asaia krungthepensis NRIC 0535]|uniref:GAF domain-containing protein n=2 Tax=Asaia krungthepensis TaxID=220990 RepID=A0ABQ0Q129_9PROT|nr:GAF domain-containing protein [Asaia krungthepensis NRIC 0535]